MPYTYDGKTRMGATWRSGKEGKLPAEEWERFKYNPRRRSLSYLIGESLMKLNAGDEGEIDEDGTVVTAARDAGPYRLRYDEAKSRAEANHPEWVACACKGSRVGKKGGKCSECMGKGKKMKRCHLHGMLCAAKMLLKNLWIEWHNTKLDIS